MFRRNSSHASSKVAKSIGAIADARPPVLRQSMFWVSVTLVVLPVLLIYPYAKSVFDYSRDWIVSRDVTEPQHRLMHLQAWWVLTFGLFTSVSWLLGFSLLIWTTCRRNE